MSKTLWTCGAKQSSCACIRKQGHTGPHVCDCGGAYSGQGESFRYFQAPKRKGFLTTKTVEAYAKKVPTKPANPLYDMWLALGGQEEEEDE